MHQCLHAVKYTLYTVSEMKKERHELGWLHINIFILLIIILFIKLKFLLLRGLIKQIISPKCIPLFQHLPLPLMKIARHM